MTKHIVFDSVIILWGLAVALMPPLDWWNVLGGFAVGLWVARLVSDLGLR